MNLVKRNLEYFPSILDEFLKPDWFGGSQNALASVPAVNIKETDQAFTLELAVPGKKKEDFSIEIDRNVLTIASETKTENERGKSSTKATWQGGVLEIKTTGTFNTPNGEMTTTTTEHWELADGGKTLKVHRFQGLEIVGLNSITPSLLPNHP